MFFFSGSENIFFSLSAVSGDAPPEAAAAAHLLSAPSQRLKHIWCDAARFRCLFCAKCELRRRWPTSRGVSALDLLAAPVGSPADGGQSLGCFCLLPFERLLYFSALLRRRIRPSAGAARFPSNSPIPQWLFRVYPAVLSVLLPVPDQKTGPL